MSEITGNRKKNPTKKNGHPSASSGKKTSAANHKKKKHSGKQVEMSYGDQIKIEDVMEDPVEETYDTTPKPKKAEKTVFDENADSSSNINPDDYSLASGQINWKKQVSSIGIWMFSVIMLALTFFPGENLWNLLHRAILGILGFKAFLWAGLMIFFGYLLTKQISREEILDIIRPTCGIIFLTDVLSYILFQSDGYRSVYNELSYNLFPLFRQMLKDGEKVGGSGLLGGLIGEMFILFAGKTGAAIITVILLSALIMILTKTGPIQLFNQAKKIIRSLLDPNFYKKLFEGEPPVKQADHFSDIDEESENSEITDVEIPPDEFSDKSDQNSIAESDAEGGGDEEDSLSKIIKAVSLKKKNKKLTRAEEIKAESEEFSKQVASSEETDTADSDRKEYIYPTVRLLVPTKNSGAADDSQELTETAHNLIRTLDEYSVKASIVHISRGPTVTRYEIKPAPGVKINKIKNLSDDIALRLAAQSVRIEAPIPGKSAVGIEIPNKNKQMVRIREILGSQEFAEAKGSLTVALGKDIEGKNVLCDLSKMPHLLIAGSTGSGKSVCVNSMLISLLYKYSPDDVRMVLIDPKSVEFDMYNGIPHLLVPVVCEPKKAAGALQWAVSEMLKRYNLLKEHGARNIDGYNLLAEQTHEFDKLCRIVIVIDEMADLMIASPKEVEDSIARLAAMARAAGMYMVLATQRPSVDVITGTIKNNIPSRIALAVSSQVDSRTILDEGGAENLIGYGDMLFHPMGTSKHIRVQGCFVEDAEVERVIRFVKQNGLAEYDDSIADEIERNSLDGAGDASSEFDDKDEFFDKAVEIVTEMGQASTSMLQRRLSVGYARAGRIVDQLEKQGIIGPSEGSKPRAVLITRAQWLEMTMNRTHSGKNDPLVRNHSEFAAQTLDPGHEEISARQKEFFNADSDDEFYDEEELFDGETAEEETLSDDDNPTTDEYSDDSGEIDRGVLNDDIPFNAQDSVPAKNNRDSMIDVELENEAKDRHVNLKKTSKAQKPNLDHSTHNKKKNAEKSSTRDFSIYFDDDTEQIDDFFDFSQKKNTDKPSRQTTGQPDDVPPWEEPVKQDNSTPDSSELVFSQRKDIPPWEEPSIPPLSEILPDLGNNSPLRTETPPSIETDDYKNDFIDTRDMERGDEAGHRRTENHKHDEKSDDDDDDPFEDVLSSPWIKKL